MSMGGEEWGLLLEIFMGLGIWRQQEKSTEKAIDRIPFWSIWQKKWRRGREFEVTLGASHTVCPNTRFSQGLRP